MIKVCYIACAWVLSLSLCAEEYKAPLGLPIEITNTYIPGPEVEPIPRSDQSSSLVIRILQITPAAEGFCYDMSLYGLDPGTYQISDYLRYKRGDDPVTVDSGVINVTHRHSLDELPKPEEMEHGLEAQVGGYRIVMILLGGFWLTGLLVLLFYRKRSKLESEPQKPPTLHDKLLVLVKTAAKGELIEQQQAELERLVIGYWKTKLPDLTGLSTAAALIKLRNHSEASPLILCLERWLHAPHGNVSQVEINKLLRPFENEEKEGDV